MLNKRAILVFIFCGIQLARPLLSNALPEEFIGKRMNHETFYGIDDDLTYVIKTNSAYYFVKFDDELLIRKFDHNGLTEIITILGQKSAHSTSFEYIGFDQTIRLTFDRNAIHKSKSGTYIKGALGICYFGHFSSLEYASEFAHTLEDIDESTIQASAKFDSAGYNRSKRLWSTQDGKYLEASYAFQDGSNLRLKGPKEESWALNIKRLSDLDQAYLEFLLEFPDFDIRTAAFIDSPRIKR